jgi:hypothetical protein
MDAPYEFMEERGGGGHERKVQLRRWLDLPGLLQLDRDIGQEAPDIDRGILVPVNGGKIDVVGMLGRLCLARLLAASAWHVLVIDLVGGGVLVVVIQLATEGQIIPHQGFWKSNRRLP